MFNYGDVLFNLDRDFPKEYKPSLCRVCDKLCDLRNYIYHLQINEHKYSVKEYFDDRIDFENNRVFPLLSNTDTNDFLEQIEDDFSILAEHLLLLHDRVLIHVQLVALFHEESPFVENKNMAEIKMFFIQNLVIYTHFIIIFKCKFAYNNCIFFRSCPIPKI